MPADPASGADKILGNCRDAMARAARARLLVGVRFRLHGRDPAYGLDCVGVIAWTFGIDDAPTGYALGSVEADWALAMLARHGFVPVVEESGRGRAAGAGGEDPSMKARPIAALPGDVLLIRCGARQIHLAVATEAGVVHACAWLRKVVEGPIPHEWKTLAVLRPGLTPLSANPAF